MKPETKTIDKLYLELSHFTEARNFRELRLGLDVTRLKAELEALRIASQRVLGEWDIWQTEIADGYKSGAMEIIQTSIDLLRSTVFSASGKEKNEPKF